MNLDLSEKQFIADGVSTEEFVDTAVAKETFSSTAAGKKQKSKVVAIEEEDSADDSFQLSTRLLRKKTDACCVKESNGSCKESCATRERG